MRWLSEDPSNDHQSDGPLEMAALSMRWHHQQASSLKCQLLLPWIASRRCHQSPSMSQLLMGWLTKGWLSILALSQVLVWSEQWCCWCNGSCWWAGTATSTATKWQRLQRANIGESTIECPSTVKRAGAVMRHIPGLVFCTSDGQRIIKKTPGLSREVALTSILQANHGLPWKNLPFQCKWQLDYGESCFGKREKPGPQPLTQPESQAWLSHKYI